jgi:hypothetical protein
VGVPALPVLEEVRRSGPPEAVRRATTALLTIRAADDSRLAVAVKSVRLNFQNKPLAAAVTDLRARTGVNVALDPKAVADPTTRTVTVKTSDVPPWQAVEAFRAAAAGLAEVFPTQSQFGLTARQFPPFDSRSPIRTAATQRPADVPVMWKDGAEPARPSADATGVRVTLIGSAFDPSGREFAVALDVTPTVGLNWQRTNEVLIGRAETADGRRLEPVFRGDPMSIQPRLGLNQNLLDELDGRPSQPTERPNSSRTFPVTFTAERPVAKLKVLEGVVCGVIYRASQPLLEIGDLPAAVGKTFAGPLGSNLTVVELKGDAVVIRCTFVSPWQLRQAGAARVGEMANAAFDSTTVRRVKLFDQDSQPIPTQHGAIRSEGNLRQESTTCTLELLPTGSTPRKPAKLVVLGTKLVPVRVPFQLQNVELK